MRTGRPPRPLEQRFKEKFSEGDPDTCWMWRGALHTQGYGLVKRKDGAQMRANRVSWEVYRGCIPEGMLVLHRCDNPGCVNPAHLFLGTHQDNMDDMIKKKRMVRNHGEKNGQHKLTDEKVLEIFKMKGAPQHAIAKQYGVCQMTVSLIKQGKRWGTLTKGL